VQITKDLTSISVTDLVAAIREKEISPVEVVDHYLERTEELNPKLNAFVAILGDQARAQARESEGRIQRGEARPLEGVPIPIKDNVLLAGVPMFEGSRMAPDMPAPMDTELVARLRNAGAVFTGKTNLPEFGTIPSTEGDRFGAAHNPWDLSRTPGGSSGGSAAAVAAGLAPAAHGNDGGGSLRIPASCCGVFSIKPSRGRVSRGPLPGNDPAGFVIDGFLTRTVRDNALLMDVVSGPGLGDPYWAPPPERPFVDEVGASPGRLRIGWTEVSPIDVPVDPACSAAVRDAAELCESLGHRVEEHTPGWRNDELLPLFMQVWASLVGTDVEFWASLGGDPSLAEPHNRALWEQGKALPATSLGLAIAKLQLFVRQILTSWETYDVILTPTLALPPVPLGWMFQGSDADPLAPMTMAGVFTPFTAQINVSGQPAASLPLSWHDGLPIGVQAIGRPAGESALYRLCAQMEEARPWADRRPPIA
jgi:amidase